MTPQQFQALKKAHFGSPEGLSYEEQGRLILEVERLNKLLADLGDTSHDYTSVVSRSQRLRKELEAR